MPTTHLDWSAKETILARARIVGERLSLKSIDRSELLATNPLIVRAGATGCAVLLRYGVIITFDLSLEEENALLAMLRPHILEPIDSRPKNAWRGRYSACRNGAPNDYKLWQKPWAKALC